MRPGNSALPILVVTMVTFGCADSDLGDAGAVVGQFCADVAAGRIEAARQHLIRSERNDPAHQFQPDGLRNGFDVGEPRATGDRTHVDVAVKGSPKPVTFELLREDGAWRISLEATMRATLGDRLEHVRRTIDAAGKQMVERFQKTLAEQASQGAPPTAPTAPGR